MSISELQECLDKIVQSGLKMSSIIDSLLLLAGVRRRESVEMKPLDMETVAASVAKTHRVVVVNEGHRTGGFSNEVAAKIMDECFYDLDGPVVRVAAEDVPIPYNATLEAEVIPAVKDILDGVRQSMN